MSRQVNSRIPNDLYARLEALAEKVGLSVSALLRVAALEYLERHEKGGANESSPKT